MNRYWAIKVFSSTLRILAVISIILGLIFSGLLIYGWGRFVTLWNIVWPEFARGFNSTASASLPVYTSDPSPLPVITCVLFTVIGSIIFAIGSLAFAQWSDLQVAQAEMLGAITKYFASLSRK